MMSYSVGELARLAGVSVRTLHHYDEVGLLIPSERTSAGYRRYDEADYERLRRILFYRDLGFDLAGISKILDDATVDVADELRQQQARLDERVGRMRATLARIERTMSQNEVAVAEPEEAQPPSWREMVLAPRKRVAGILAAGVLMWAGAWFFPLDAVLIPRRHDFLQFVPEQARAVARPGERPFVARLCVSEFSVVGPGAIKFKAEHAWSPRSEAMWKTGDTYIEATTDFRLHENLITCPIR